MSFVLLPPQLVWPGTCLQPPTVVIAEHWVFLCLRAPFPAARKVQLPLFRRAVKGFVVVHQDQTNQPPVGKGTGFQKTWNKLWKRNSLLAWQFSIYTALWTLKHVECHSMILVSWMPGCHFCMRSWQMSWKRLARASSWTPFLKANAWDPLSVWEMVKKRVCVSELVNGTSFLQRWISEIARLGRRWFPFPEATDCMVQGLCHCLWLFEWEWLA